MMRSTMLLLSVFVVHPIFAQIQAQDSATAGPFFEGLGFAAGASRSEAGDVSSDGAVIVGASGSEAFRWTEDNGVVSIGVLPGDSKSAADAVSMDGMVVAANSSSGKVNEAVLWTPEGGMLGLGVLPGYEQSFASGLSANGEVVVGWVEGQVAGFFRSEAFRWTKQDGMVGLGTLPGRQNSNAFSISGDASVIVGRSGDLAFQWTSSDGMQELGFLPSADFSSAADVSSDGSVIVGTSGNRSPPLPRTNQAFRWTRDEGLVGLGMLPGDQTSSAVAVSADGSIVLGQSRLSSTEFTTFVWDDMKGMRSVRDFLTNELGLSHSIEGWTRISVHDLSADNSTYVGSGVNPDGNREAWRVVIPEPSTLALALIAVIGFGALVRQRLPVPHLSWPDW